MGSRRTADRVHAGATLQTVGNFMKWNGFGTLKFCSENPPFFLRAHDEVRVVDHAITRRFKVGFGCLSHMACVAPSGNEEHRDALVLGNAVELERGRDRLVGRAQLPGLEAAGAVVLIKASRWSGSPS